MKGKKIFAVVIACALALSFACGPKQTVTPLEKGIGLFEGESYEEAKAEFEALVAQEPVDPTAAAYLGRIALEKEEADEAAMWLDKAVSLDETNADFHFWLAQAYLAKLRNASFMEQGAIAPKFKQELEKAAEHDPRHVEARIYLANYYLNAPPMAGGSVKKAEELAAEVRQLDADRGHQLAAQIYVKKNDFESAEKEYLALAEKDPKDPDLHFQMGMFYQTAKWWDKAYGAFEQVLVIDPERRSALYQIGRTGVFSGDKLDRAVECLKEYLKQQPPQGAPTWANAHWRLGMIYEKMGNKDLARQEYEEALKLNPDDENARKALENL